MTAEIQGHTYGAANENGYWYCMEKRTLSDDADAEFYYVCEKIL